MLIVFELSMPNVGSWNGKWTGEKDYHARVRRFCGNDLPKAREILAKKSYDYNFGDGWRAEVDVMQVDSKEAARIRKKSVGFCGYDWMIDSIIHKGDIYNSRGERGY